LQGGGLWGSFQAVELGLGTPAGTSIQERGRPFHGGRPEAPTPEGTEHARHGP
jgi:hypothetical protein